MIEHQAVHMDVPAHHGKRGFAPHHDIVQRRDLLVVPLRTNHQPPLDGVIPAEQALNGLAQLTCLHFGQKTQLAEIDTEHRNAVYRRAACYGQYASVSAANDERIAFFNDLFAGKGISARQFFPIAEYPTAYFA